MNSLNQFFSATSTGGFVANLFTNILSSPLGSAFMYINIAISIFAVLTVCKQLAARSLTAGETAKATGTAGFAIRIAIIPIFCVPAVDGKLSLAQAGVLKIAEFGSNFGDFTYSKLPNIRESILVSFSAAPTDATTPKLSVSADIAEIIGKLYKLRYCQFTLSWRGDWTVPDITSRIVAGATVLSFGGPAQIRAPGNICGSITLPLSSTDSKNDVFSRIGNAIFSFSNPIADEILEVHKSAIELALSEIDAALRTSFPTNMIWSDEHWSRLQSNMQITASNYQARMLAAGAAVFTPQATDKTSVQDQKLGWLNAGFGLALRSNQIAGRVAALTWRPSIVLNNIERAYPFPRGVLPQFEGIDSRFNYSLQVAGLTKIPAGAAAGGMALENFLSGGDIRSAIELMTNPFANVFDVAASVGPILTAAAAAGLAAYTIVSAFVPGIGTFVSLALGTLALAGQGLTVIVPLAPAIAWLFLILSWFSGVLVLFCIVSFYSISVSNDETTNPFSGKLNELFSRAFILLFTPAMLVIGLALIFPVIQIGWFFVVAAVGPAIKNSTAESAVASAISVIIITLIMISLITSLIYFSVSKLASAVKGLAEILEAPGGTLAIGERVTGGETVTTAPTGPASPLSRQSGTPGASGGAGGPVGLGSGTGGVDKNAQHVSNPTRGSRN